MKERVETETVDEFDGSELFVSQNEGRMDRRFVVKYRLYALLHQGFEEILELEQ